MVLFIMLFIYSSLLRDRPGSGTQLALRRSRYHGSWFLSHQAMIYTLLSREVFRGWEANTFLGHITA